MTQEMDPLRETDQCHHQVELVALPDLHRSVIGLNLQSICMKYHTKVPCLQSTKIKNKWKKEEGSET